MKELFLFVLVFLALFVLLIAMPFAFLWSVNALFGLSIPFDLRHLFAAWVLLFVIRIATRTDVDHEALRR